MSLSDAGVGGVDVGRSWLAMPVVSVTNGELDAVRIVFAVLRGPTPSSTLRPTPGWSRPACASTTARWAPANAAQAIAKGHDLNLLIERPLGRRLRAGRLMGG